MVFVQISEWIVQIYRSLPRIIGYLLGFDSLSPLSKESFYVNHDGNKIKKYFGDTINFKY